MNGMNAVTGLTLSGTDHLMQSVERILMTPLATCLQRRTFGSELPELVDAPNNATTRVRLYAATVTALMRWEPRLTVTRVQLASESANPLDGSQTIDIEGLTDARDTPVTLRVPVTNGATA
ncbi:GPW/gp25 family protein [Burkholderia sp. Ac-20379]|uniref:GPW/gp25 family protein n=1 Tax=Burkholderia sp. Ac-20379 TaxID=2703900 RepID=UPI00197D4808|nr:GPW/gp25 family protein [Burkholderia sp. Ac-20379]MBN3725626.1 baseplate assembly protein [Burkholderia sp. Ac-20379]